MVLDYGSFSRYLCRKIKHSTPSKSQWQITSKTQRLCPFENPQLTSTKGMGIIQVWGPSCIRWKILLSSQPNKITSPARSFARSPHATIAA